MIVSVSPCLLPELSLVKAVHYNPKRNLDKNLSTIEFHEATMSIVDFTTQENFSSREELPPFLLKKREDISDILLSELSSKDKLKGDMSTEAVAYEFLQNVIYDSLLSSSSSDL